MSTDNNEKRDARAELAAAKARAKASKSWPQRHKFLTALGLGAVVVVVASVAGGGGGGDAQSASSDSTSQSARQPAAKVPAKPAAKVAGLNQKVRDGQFEFTVSKVSCGKTKIGDQYLSTKAQGQFCLVSIHVKNVGESSQMLDGSSQEAFDADGKKYSSSDEASIYLGDKGQVFLNEINPGNAVDGTVVYDVPKGAELTQLQLHDSMFSGGVKVAVK